MRLVLCGCVLWHESHWDWKLWIEEKDEGLIAASKAEGSEYQFAANGTILVHERVATGDLE